MLLGVSGVAFIVSRWLQLPGCRGPLRA